MSRYAIGLFLAVLCLLALLGLLNSLGQDVRYVAIPGGTTIASADTVVVRVPFPIFLQPAPVVAFQDEEIGAWRVDEPISLYCFPLRED